MDTIQIPLRNRRHEIVAETLIDSSDAALTGERWCLNSNGYAWRDSGQHSRPRHEYLHRRIMGMSPGDGLFVDHINRNKLDNRRANLRVVTPAESRQNTPSLGGSSPYRGVGFDRSRGKWQAQMQLNRRHYSLGRFATAEEAAAVARAWRLEHMPFAVES